MSDGAVCEEGRIVDVGREGSGDGDEFVDDDNGNIEWWSLRF